MCCICVFSWYLKFCSEPSCSPLKPLILTTMSWHACPSSGKIVNSACSYNLNTKSGWPGPLLFFLHPLSARHSLCEHQRGRQAGRALMPARLGGLMVQPRGRVRPLRRTKAAHNERKRAWISPPSWKIARFSFHGAIQRWLQKDEDDLCILARPKPNGLTPAFGSFCKR